MIKNNERDGLNGIPPSDHLADFGWVGMSVLFFCEHFCGPYEVHEKRMRLLYRALEFGMVLNPYEEGMRGYLDDLDESRIGVSSAGDHAGFLHIREIGVIELPAMAVPF